MISKKDIIQAVRKITKQKSGAAEHRIMHPERDWAIGLALSAVLFTAGVSYTGYEFLTHLEEAEKTVTVDSSVIQYDQEAVSDVLETYGTREKQFNTLRADRSNAASLPPGTTTTEAEEDAPSETTDDPENGSAPEIAI